MDFEDTQNAAPDASSSHETSKLGESQKGETQSVTKR